MSARIGEGGWSTKCGQAWTGQGEGMRGGGLGFPKIPKFVRTSFMDDPKGRSGDLSTRQSLLQTNVMSFDKLNLYGGVFRNSAFSR